MTKVSLITKNSAGKFVEDSVVQIGTAATKTITLKPNTILKLEIKPEDISSVAKEGNNAVIYLKDGTKVVLENFYIVDNPQILLQNGQQFWTAKLTQDATSQAVIDYVELSNVPALITASDTIPMWNWLVGGLAGATAVAVFSEKDSKDTTPPISGSLSFSHFVDTGHLPTDYLSQDKSFTLVLTGQEANTSITYLMSKDNGQTWTETTVNQTDLADGSYQFKAIVKDAAGNSSETAVQKVVIDTTAPNAGVLQLSDFIDTGMSETDQISQDKSFTLALTGQEIGANVTYLMSKDNGQTWTETTVNQTDLADGSYQFKAIVKDAAGNSSETAVQKVVIDTTAPNAGVLQLSDFTDTGMSETDQISQDKSFTLALTGQEIGANVTYLMSKDNGQIWTETTVNQTDLADGSYQFKAIVKDAAGNSSETAVQKVVIDTTAPNAGVLQLSDFTDTGMSETDQISQDKSFTLALTGQEIGANVTYLMSKDNGQTWTETTVNQTDLADGSYQFKAIVKDAAGNSSETAVQKVMIDTTAPNAGVLQLSDFTDTGMSESDQISQDKSFTLQLTQPIIVGEQIAFLDHFEVSTDGGQTWNITDAAQTDLVDGLYQFKAVVTDIAGNHSETAIQQVTVDRKLELLNNIVKIKSVTDDNAISLSEKDQTIPIRIQIDHLPNDVNQTLTNVSTLIGETIINFTFDPTYQDWVAEIPATSLWSEGQQNSLTIDVRFVDIAGNTTTLQQSHDFQINHIPIAPQLLVAKSNNLDGSIISGTAYKGSIVDFYTVSGEWIASTVANEQGEFTLKTSLINADQEIYVTAKVDDYISDASLPITVVEVPFLNIIKISPEGIITGYATEGSHFSVRDSEGKLIQVFSSVKFDDSIITPLNLMNLGGVQPFTLTLDKPLAEGSEIIITAEKDGFIGYPQLIVTDYTPAEFLEKPVFNEEGNHLLVHTNEPNTLILVFADSSENMIGFGYSDGNGVAHVEISQTLNEGEQVRVQLVDKNQNMSEVIIEAPNFAYAPNVYHISQEGLISGWVETNSTIIVKDANGIVLGEKLSGEGFIWNHDFTEFNLLVNRSLTDGEQLFIHIIDVKGLVSPETVINVDFTPPPAPTHLYFNEEGDWIYGTAEAFTEITITDKNGTVLNHWGWDRWTDQDGNFAIELNHYLTNADIVYVTAKDSNGNISLVTEVTAPNYAFAPIIENLTNQGLFTGYAESNSTLIIKDAHNVTIAEIVISNNNSGNDLSYFSFNLNKSLINSETFSLSIIDHNGLISAETIVIADVVAPEPAQNVMFTEDGYYLNGMAELGSTIQIFDRNGTQVNWYANVQLDGSFHIGLGNHYLHGEAFTVTVTDRAGNISQAISINAPIDDIAPNPIENIVLNENGSSFIANAEANSRIEVLDQSGRSVGWGSTDSQGNVSGYFNQIYLHGEQLTFVVVDRAGNRSTEVKQIALIDNIAPLAADNITIAQEGWISGEAEPHTTIEILDQYGAIITTTYVGYDGSFEQWINLSQYQTQNLSIIVEDAAGNRSEAVHELLPALTNTPNVATDLKLDIDGHILTGMAIAGMVITVTCINGERIDGWWNNIVNEDGRFNIQLNDYYLQGETLQVRVLNPNTNQYSPITEIITPLDNIAPVITDVVIGDNGYSVEGQSDPKAIIKVIDADGDFRGEYQADNTGYFYLNIYPPILRGEKIFITAIDLAKNESSPFGIIFNADINAPSPAENIVISDNGFFISGDAVPNSYLKIVNTQGFLIGDIIVSKWGHFNIELNNPQATGEVLRIVVEQNGYQSNYTEIITPIDIVAPAIATQFAVNQSGYLIGHAEPRALVEITYNFDGQPSYTNTVIAKKEGIFEVYMNNKATSLAVTVIDSEGNQSATVIIKPEEIPQIEVDQFRGDHTDNIYQVDHSSDFIQEHRIEHYKNYKEVWVDDSHYVSQWFDGYYEEQWIEGHYEPVLIEGHYEEMWFDNGEWRHRDYYSDQDGKRYYTDDGSYEAYVNQYFDSELGLWQDGYALNGPEIEQEWVSNLYSLQIWVGDSYKDRWVGGHYENVWVEGHEEYSWVESGHWENQLIESGYREVDFGGHDKVLSSISYSLMGNYDWVNDPESIKGHLESGRYVEDIELVGSANINATGNVLNNVITGNAGNNILDGHSGHDTYIGGAGSDTVIYNTLNYSDGLVDRWQDFHVGHVWTDLQADKIDLSQLLMDYAGDGSVASLEKFIHVNQEGENTIVSIDRDGETFVESSVQLVVLNNVNTTLNELLDNHQIII